MEKVKMKEEGSNKPLTSIDEHGLDLKPSEVTEDSAMLEVHEFARINDSPSRFEAEIIFLRRPIEYFLFQGLPTSTQTHNNLSCYCHQFWSLHTWNNCCVPCCCHPQSQKVKHVRGRCTYFTLPFNKR